VSRDSGAHTARIGPAAARPLTRRGSVSIAGPSLVQVSQAETVGSPGGGPQIGARRVHGPLIMNSNGALGTPGRSPQGGPGPGTAPTAYVRAPGPAMAIQSGDPAPWRPEWRTSNPQRAAQSAAHGAPPGERPGRHRPRLAAAAGCVGSAFSPGPAPGRARGRHRPAARRPGP
jgi:hypothetical protein